MQNSETSMQLYYAARAAEYDRIYAKPERQRDLAAIKRTAMDRLAAARIGVVLVPTIVAGVNDHQIGDLVHQASGCGRCPAATATRFRWHS